MVISCQAQAICRDIKYMERTQGMGRWKNMGPRQGRGDMHAYNRQDREEAREGEDIRHRQMEEYGS